MAKNTPFLKDWFLLGMTTGMTASVAKSMVNYALDKAGIPTVGYSTLAGNMVLGRRGWLGGLVRGGPRTLGDRLIGHVLDTIVGGAYGVTLSYVYSKTPPGNEATKGMLGGAALGAATLALGNQWNVTGFHRLTAGKIATLLAMSTLFGGLEGWVLGRYGAKLAAQSHPVLVKAVSNKAYERGRLAAAHVRRAAAQTPSAAARPLDEGLSSALF